MVWGGRDLKYEILEKSRLHEDLIVVIQYLKGTYKNGMEGSIQKGL